jgi:glycine/D-amino acid oxidase-like deaminating enzyme
MYIHGAAKSRQFDIAATCSQPYIGSVTESYWHIKNRGLIGNKPSPDLPSHADIAIIGGGLVGIATAHYLRQMGCSNVIVLEKKFVGYGASGRNAGFLLSGMAEPYSRLVVGMGSDGARTLNKSTIENHSLIAEAIAQKGIACNYRRTGSYHLAVSEVEADELRESVDLLCADNFDSEYIERNVIGERLGFGNYAGGSFNPVDGNLDPFAFVNGLASGITVIDQFEVTRIEKRDGGVKISGDGKSIMAEMAVLATNAYTPLIDSHFDELIFPVRGQMLATSPNRGCALRDMTYYANFGYDYFRQAPDDTILMGGLRDRFIGTEVGFEDATNQKLQQGLEEYVRDNIGAREFSVEARWSGVMGNTIDGLPLVGPLPHNSAVIAAVGCNGHGFGLGMVVARDVARAIVKGETSDLLRRFSIKRFSS